MSESEADLTNARWIALFPLNVILYPGMRLPLRIFEPRYRLMTRRCLGGELEFGVTLIRTGPEVGGQAIPYQIGTLARIIESAEHPDGRFSLLTEGTERFQIHRMREREPYLEGLVSPLAEDDPPAGQLGALVHTLGELFNHYWERIFRLAGRPVADLDLAPTPRELTYQVAQTLQIDPAERQNLLEIDSVEARLTKEITILRSQNQILDRVLQERATPSDEPRQPFRFSKN